MPTISDIAKVSGVSTATVSYVLNNRKGAVSAETRERVLGVMRELNYRPSPLIMRKHAAKANALGVTFMHPNMTSLTDHPWITLLLDGILSVTTPIHWDLVLLTANSTANFHQVLRNKCDGRCDGLVLLGMSTQPELVDVLKERGLPFVCVNMGNNMEGVTCVDVDNETAAREAINLLLKLGHRRIGLLAGDAKSENSISREVGYRSALCEAGLTPEPMFAPPGVFTEMSGHERALRLLSMPAGTRPTAFFCASDRIAFGAIKAAGELGLKVPDDVSVIGFDDVPKAAECEPPLTTVRQPLLDLGRRAAELLLGEINEMARPGQKDILATRLILRETTGPAR